MLRYASKYHRCSMDSMASPAPPWLSGWEEQQRGAGPAAARRHVPRRKPTGFEWFFFPSSSFLPAAAVQSHPSKMAAVEPETTDNPLPTDEEKTETGQEVVSPENYIKHPLQNRWALWFFKNDKSKTWQANLRLISKFDTVEDFWALYNHIQLSSNLISGCDYSLFKDGVEPMWEDEKNRRGGRWLITLNKPQRRNDLDRFWLETVGL
ncbi:hypothetical protein FKM82_001048 [Ascaphus truei]